MSQYQDNIIPCVGGLDLITPKSLAQPGTLMDCVNYYVDSTGGYTQSKQHIVYDGQFDLPRLNFYLFQGATSGAITEYPNGNNCTYTSSNRAGIYFFIPYNGVTDPTDSNAWHAVVPTERTNGLHTKVSSTVTITWSGGSATVSAGTGATRFTFGNIENDNLLFGVVQEFYVKFFKALYEDDLNGAIQTTSIDASLGSTYDTSGLFYFEDDLYCVVGDISGGHHLRKTSSSGWSSVDMGQEMAFDSGEFQTKFEDFIVWDGGGATSEEELDSLKKGGTSSVDTLDYFPGQVIYWRDSTDTDREYWATVVHAYEAGGAVADTDLEGALTLYDVHDRTSGGTLTESADGAFPLSATTGAFGKWTEGNALNFTSGGTYEPQIGDQIDDGGGQQATVLKVIVDAGAWAEGDATGTLVVGEISGTGTFTTPTTLDIGANTNVLTTANAVNDTDRNDILHNTSTNVDVLLPTHDHLLAEEAKTVSVVHNFFATDDSLNPTPVQIPRAACYVTNGAGFCYRWDGQHLIRIRTGILVDSDKPRHVSVHANRLCLSYADGTVVLSVPGQPMNFSGVDGAAQFGFGKKITGLHRLSGNATAVFTEDSVNILQGFTNDDTVIREISNDSGAIEYTVADIGTAIYLDRHGIATIDQAEQYGDFIRNRISSPVRPWLEARINAKYDRDLDIGVGSAHSNPVDIIPDFAIAVPSQSQYKIVFKDGIVLSCSLWNALSGNRPQFTFERLWPQSETAQGTSEEISSFLSTKGVNDEDVVFYVRSDNLFYSGGLNYDPHVLQLWAGDFLIDQPCYVVFNPIKPNPSTSMQMTSGVGKIHGRYNGYLWLAASLTDLSSSNGKVDFEDKLDEVIKLDANDLKVVEDNIAYTETETGNYEGTTATAVKFDHINNFITTFHTSVNADQFVLAIGRDVVDITLSHPTQRLAMAPHVLQQIELPFDIHKIKRG